MIKIPNGKMLCLRKYYFQLKILYPTGLANLGVSDTQVQNFFLYSKHPLLQLRNQFQRYARTKKEIESNNKLINRT